MGLAFLLLFAVAFHYVYLQMEQDNVTGGQQGELITGFLLTAGLGNASEPGEAGSQESLSDTAGGIEDVLEKKTISRFYDPVEVRGEILTELFITT